MRCNLYLERGYELKKHYRSTIWSTDISTNAEASEGSEMFCSGFLEMCHNDGSLKTTHPSTFQNFNEGGSPPRPQHFLVESSLYH